jgi:hypothetical protein
LESAKCDFEEIPISIIPQYVLNLTSEKVGKKQLLNKEHLRGSDPVLLILVKK